MKRFGAVLLIVAAVLMAASPAFAASGVTVEATAGIDGYVAPNRPTTVNATVSADVPFVGTMRIKVGGTVIATPVEVPAGSTKIYTVTLPTVPADAFPTVQLIPEGASKAIEVTPLKMEVPGDEVLVGVYGSSDVLTDLGSVLSVPFSTRVLPLEVTDRDFANNLPTLPYLILGKGSVTQLQPGAAENIRQWMREGGNLVLATEDVSAFGAPPGDLVPLTDEANLVNVGDGEMITVADPSNVRDWATILRSVPAARLGGNEQFFGGPNLVQAAGNSRQTAEALPWLLAALAVYVVVVGPLNVLALRRTGRMDLVWLTVPAISLVAVGAIWFVGHSSGTQRVAAHATTIARVGETTRAHSAIVFSAGGEGKHTLSLPPSWLAAPYDFRGMFGVGSTAESTMTIAPDGGVHLTMDLPSLGMGAVEAAWQPPPVDVTASRTGKSFRVANGSDLTFTTWGVGSLDSFGVSFDPLTPGAGATVVVGSAFESFGGPMPIADMLINSIMATTGKPTFGTDLNPEQIWNTWYGMITDAQVRYPEAFTGTYFFGITDDVRPAVEIDGSRTEAAGQAFVVVPLDSTGEPIQGIGRLVAIEGATFIQDEGPTVYASSPDGLDVLFNLPPETTGKVQITLDSEERPAITGIDVYDWAAGAFDSYEWPGAIPAADHIGPDGTLAVKVSFGSGSGVAGGPGPDLFLPEGGIRAVVQP